MPRKVVKSYKKRPKKAAIVSIKKQLMRMAETKTLNFQDPSENILHNNFYVLSPSQMILQGNTSETRVGDSVHLQNIKICGILTSSTAANAAQKYRIMVFWSKSSTTATAWANVGAGTDVFHPNTYTFLVNGIVNPKAITILSDMVVDINCNVSGAAEVKSFAFTVPINQKYDYQTPGGSLGKYKNLFIAVTPYIGGGTTGVTSAGFIALSTSLAYKDI